MSEPLKVGDRLYTGAIVSEEFAATYNSATERIESYRARFGYVPETMLNGRHNLLTSYAVAFGKGKN